MQHPLVIKLSQCWVAVLCLVCAAFASAIELEGKFVQGGLLYGQAKEGDVVRFKERIVEQTEQGKFIVGLGRDFESPLELYVTNAAGEEQTFQYEIEKRDYNVQRIEGIAKAIMSPSKEQIDRSRKENAKVGQARRVITYTPYYESGFKWPLIGPITGVYGSQRVYNGVPKRPHFGVDVAAPTGTPVKAPAAGIVRLAYDNMFFSGGTMIIDHGFGLSSSYLHLSEMLVKEGDYVDTDTDVALVGATGRVTGPHLDWRMNWYEQRIDPQLLVPAMPKK